MFYNVNTSKSIVQLFHILLFTGNTCIYSFLCVFLRHLGLSAFQVGLLRGLQSFTSLICIPVVVICGRKCLQRRPPMMACLFLTMAAYLSLLVISLPAPSCFHKDFPVCENSTIHQIRNNSFAHATTEITGKHISQRSPTLAASMDRKFVTEAVTAHEKSNNVSSSMYRVTGKFPVSSNRESMSAQVSKKNGVSQVTPVSELLVMSQAHPASSPKPLSSPTSHSFKAQSHSSPSSHSSNAIGNRITVPVTSQEAQRYAAVTSDQTKYVYISRNPSYFYDTSQPQLGRESIDRRPKRSHSLKSVSVFRNISSGQLDVINHKGSLWPSVDISCFIILLLILLIAEAAASPVDTIASDAWYNYLDEIDYLVAYTKRSISVPICAAVTVFVIGCITLFYCGISPALNAYNLHIYTFGIFLGFALVVTFFYPFPQEQKTFYRNVVTIGHSLQSKEAFALFITAVISGILQSATTDYTLWFIEDVGGSEFITSTAVSVGLISIAIPQVCQKRAQSMSSRSAMVAFGMFCSAAQFLIYVAIQIPWAVVAAQLLHFASTYLFWSALKQRLMKVLKLKSEHSLTLTLKGFNLLGYTMGVVLNGLLYTYSPTLLFSTMALLALVWCLVLFFCEFCCLHSVSLMMPDDREEEMKLFDDLQQDSDED